VLKLASCIATAFARCYGAEGTLAYAPVTALLRGLPLPPLGPVWLAEIARLLPAVLAAHPDLPRPGPLTETWQRQRLFEALTRALLGHQLLLVVVDDLHWCDEDSLAWLHYLLLVGTLRPEALAGDRARAALWPDLRTAGRLREIELRPLDRRETAELAASVSGEELDEDRLEQLYAETEGNPLFVLETVRAGLLGTGALPPTVRTVLEARLAGCIGQLHYHQVHFAQALDHFERWLVAARAGVSGRGCRRHGEPGPGL
jgi:hypothetical protein